jgi:hypothetical protein
VCLFSVGDDFWYLLGLLVGAVLYGLISYFMVQGVKFVRPFNFQKFSQNFSRKVFSEKSHFHSTLQDFMLLCTPRSDIRACYDGDQAEIKKRRSNHDFSHDSWHFNPFCDVLYPLSC